MHNNTPPPSFATVTEFENRIAEFFGAPYAVATDGCTSALELCLRYTRSNYIASPRYTYLSVPMLANKLNLTLNWVDQRWSDYYYVTNEIIDAAVFWERNGYIPETFMCISMQHQKHLSLGRVGVILCDNKAAADTLRKQAYDGRERDIPWRDQSVSMFGFHYYCLPELAQKGLDKLQAAIDTPPKKWSWQDYPDLLQMDVFKK